MKAKDETSECKIVEMTTALHFAAFDKHQWYMNSVLTNNSAVPGNHVENTEFGTKTCEMPRRFYW